MAAAKPLPEAILDARIDVLKLQAAAQKAGLPNVAAALSQAVESLQEAEKAHKA